MFDSPAVLKRLATASRQLAELKGVSASIPNQRILISTLGLQEAKDSSAIESIVTTHAGAEQRWISSPSRYHAPESRW